ncbi:MAG: hypothetical protein K8E24_003070 [Methanobacterium paludis]|nr:hypothetical protein [Methanobacterium paludis]
MENKEQALLINNIHSLKCLNGVTKLIQDNKQLMKMYPEEEGLELDQFGLEEVKKDILKDGFQIKITVPVELMEDEECYVAKLACGVASQGKTVEDALNAVTEALLLYLDGD